MHTDYRVRVVFAGSIALGSKKLYEALLRTGKDDFPGIALPDH